VKIFPMRACRHGDVIADVPKRREGLEARRKIGAAFGSYG